MTGDAPPQRSQSWDAPPPNPNPPDAPVDAEFLVQVRTHCVVAAQAVGLAVSEDPGPLRDELAEWARAKTITAVRSLLDDRFWDPLDLETHGPLPPAGAARDEVVDEVKDALSQGLTHILVQVGYRPPPPPWRLVGAARTSIDAAMTLGARKDVAAAKANLEKLLEALESLMIKAADPGFARKLMERSKGVVTVGAAVALILGHGVIEESVGKEFLYPAVTTVIADVTGVAPADHRAVGPGEKPSEGKRHAAEAEPEATEREILRERLREARARADLAELELLVAEERFERQAEGEQRLSGGRGERPQPSER